MNREDSVLDEIDRLVDESLARGDQSDSFHGEQYRQDQPCPWCVEGYHYLPITQQMWMMRQGSYAVDEFGYGIVDPDYRVEDDDSPILCPGSEFHGPPYYYNGLKLWDKQSRERAKEIPVRSGTSRYQPDVEPYLPPGRIRRLRFHGPFGAWTIALEDERDIEDIVSDPASVGMPGPRRRIPHVRAQRLTATFTLTHDIRNPTREWLERNMPFMVDQELRMTSEGTFVTMQDVVIPFRNLVVHSDSPHAHEPEWVEFETSYDITRVPWFAEWWVWSGTEEDVVLPPRPSVPRPRQGHESDYVVIDEAYSFTNEELRRHVDEAQSTGSRPPSAQAYDEAQRRSAILRGGQENPP